MASDAMTLSTSARWWIWGLPIAFIVHDGEEVVATLRAGQLQSIGAPLTVSQALAGILFELALLWLVSVLAVWSGRPGWPMRIFAVALCGYTLHGVVHVVAGVVGTGYVFGATTALPAVVVYGCLALYRLHADRLLSRREILGALLVGAVLGGPFIYLVQLVGRVIG